MGGDYSNSKSSRRKKRSGTRSSSSSSDSESQEERRSRRRRRRHDDRHRSTHGSRRRESEASEKSRRRKSRRDRKEKRKIEHQRRSSRQDKKDVSDSDGFSSSSGDTELKVGKPEKIIHYMLKKFPGVAGDLKQVQFYRRACYLLNHTSFWLFLFVCIHSYTLLCTALYTASCLSSLVTDIHCWIEWFHVAWLLHDSWLDPIVLFNTKVTHIWIMDGILTSGSSPTMGTGWDASLCCFQS